jgi:flagellar basal-body rod modification protein FlgD
MNVSSVTTNTSTTNPLTAPAASAATTPTAATTSATAAADTFANPSSTLNQADFLQLLVAQIQYQDPMNPQSDTDMAAQLAQFSSLQQATQSTSSLAMMQANGLVGSTVTVQVDSQNSASGVVTGVVLDSGAAQITIDGTNYNLSQVTAVAPTTLGATSGTATTPTTTPSTQTTQ